MTALSRDRSLDQVGAGLPTIVQVPVDGGTHLYMGSSAAPLTATGMLAVGGGVASTNAVMGICKNEVNNASGSDGDYSADLAQGVFARENSSGSPCVAATIGKVVYAEDDQTVRVASGATYPVLGVFLGFMEDGTTPLVFVSSVVNYLLSQTTLSSNLAAITNALGASLVGLEDAANNLTATNMEAGIAEIFTRLAAITATNGCNLLGFQDSGNKTTAATADTALDEIYANLTTANGSMQIDGMAILAAGTQLAAFADNNGASAPGITLADSKAMGIRWNNQAGQTAVFRRFTMPLDIDITADAYLVCAASKTGATVGDATKFTIALFNNAVGALHDADTDFGGDTNAMTGDATAKTVQTASRTLTAADLPAAGTSVTMSIKPKDGTLGTDDVILEAVQLKYTKKLSP